MNWRAATGTVRRILRILVFLFLVQVLIACAGLGVTRDELGLGREGSTVRETHGKELEGSKNTDFPENPYQANRPEISDDVKLWFSEALVEIQEGNYSVAEQHLMDLHQQYPALSGPVLNLGIVYKRQGRRSEAMRMFQQSLEVNPYNLEAYNQIAIFCREDGEFAKAEESYQAALDIWPGYALAYLNLGVLYELYLGRFEEAKGMYETYLDVIYPEQDRLVEGWIKDLERRIAP